MKILPRWCGHVCVAVGVVGVFVPLLPTTPLLLLAAFLYSHSSPALREKLLSNPRFGPAMRAWYERGAISTRSKVAAVVAIVAGLAFPLLVIDLPAWLRHVHIGLALALILFITTRPAGALPKEEGEPDSAQPGCISGAGKAGGEASPQLRE